MNAKLTLLAGILCLSPVLLSAQSTAFTYQGLLQSAGAPADGLYEMQFALYDALDGGNLVDTPQAAAPVAVSNGLFTVQLNVGAGAFTGADRWLEITVNLFGSDMVPITLKPRQPLTPAPYALHALNAARLMSFDNAPLDIKVNGERALRLEAGAGGAPNVIGGSSVNSAAQGVLGATIGGGGSSMPGFEAPNRVRGNFGTIGGGGFNTIDTGANNSVIGGGQGNVIAEGATHSVIGGGINNTNAGYESVVGGGFWNMVADLRATIGGGAFNRASGSVATVAGGFQNHAAGYVSTVAGGYGNRAQGSYGSVGGGQGNSSENLASTVAGGESNHATADYASVGGGHDNIATAYGAVVAGGGGRLDDGDIEVGNSATGGWTVVSGGMRNESTDFFATVGGGGMNHATGFGSVVAGGGGVHFEDGNEDRGNTAGGDWSAVAGGADNFAEGLFSVIAGGEANRALGNYATIPGGLDCEAAGLLSFAAGWGAKALHDGSFVWADNSPTFGGPPFASTTNNQFNARAAGGVRFYTDFAATTGAELEPGSGSWSSLSDRNAKENFTAANGQEILDKVAALPLASWNYKAQNASVRHLGPTAQDFHAAFGLGANDRTIASVDADGVALAAIQGLNRKLDEQLKAKDAEMRALQRTVEELKALVQRLAPVSSSPALRPAAAPAE